MAKDFDDLVDMQEMENDNNILIVDALNLAFRYKHAKKKEFKLDYLRTVESLAKSYGCSKIIITCDFGASTFRKNLYPEYKGDREDKVANQTEEEKQEFAEFFEEFNNTMEYVGQLYPVLRFKGVEADDLAAYLTSKFYSKTPNHIWLISSDKDWDLLINEKVSRFSFVTRKEYTLENWNTYYEYEHDQALCIKTLVGGKDNVTGIPGIGPKRALQLIQKYGSAVDILIEAPIEGKAKYIQSLNENIDIIERNLTLIDKISWCEEAIGKKNIEQIKEIL